MNDELNIKSKLHAKLLSDSPTSKDELGSHDAIARALFRIVNSDSMDKSHIQKPYVIGLFGKWGSGKSSIIKMWQSFYDNLENKGNTVIVELDAWSIGVNNFTRHILRKCTEQIVTNDSKKRELLDTISTDKKEDIELPKETVAGFKKAIFCVISILIPVFISIAYLGWLNNIHQWHLPITLIFSMVSLLATVYLVHIILPQYLQKRTRRIENIFFNDPSYFRKMLRDILKEAGKIKNICIVVDNLDRLEKDDSLNILGRIKTFIVERDIFNKLIFIIPCDPSQLVDRIDGSNSPKMFIDENERLRKHFNTSLVIPPPIWEDLESYGRDLLITSEFNLSDADRAEIASSLERIYNKNPRQIKQFINNFISQYQIAIEMERSGNLIPPITDDIPVLSFFLVLWFELKGENMPQDIKSIEKIVVEKHEPYIHLIEFIKSRRVIWSNISEEKWENLLNFKTLKDESRFNKYRELIKKSSIGEFIDLYKSENPDEYALTSYLMKHSRSNVDVLHLAKSFEQLKKQDISINLNERIKRKFSELSKADISYILELSPSFFYDEVVKDILNSIVDIFSNVKSSYVKLMESAEQDKLTNLVDWFELFAIKCLQNNIDDKTFEELNSTLRVIQENSPSITLLIFQHPDYPWLTDSIGLATIELREATIPILKLNILSLYFDENFEQDNTRKNLGIVLTHLTEYLYILNDQENSIKDESQFDLYYEMSEQFLNRMHSGSFQINATEFQLISTKYGEIFSEISDWKEALKVLNLQKLTYGLNLDGLNIEEVNQLLKMSLDALFESDETEYIVKILEEYPDDVIWISHDQLLDKAEQNKDIFHSAIVEIKSQRINVINHFLRQQPILLTKWLRKNVSIIQEEIPEVSNSVLTFALPGKEADEKYCVILTLLSLAQDSPAFSNKIRKFDEVISNNPNNIEGDFKNIYQAFVWSKWKPTRTQRDHIHSRAMHLSASDAKSLNSLRRRFNRIETWEDF